MEGVRGTGFYESEKWQKLRNEIRKRDKMTCKMCGNPITGKCIVDHIIPLTKENVNDWDIAYNPDNLQLLCISCHNAKTFTNHTKAISLW